ncbi:hypothetical protein PC118_g20479 [Phytophthora cactorum]|uniref:Tyr recombinase domain-containing protein n=1 Tax=Phytophthora cactorum TaxID=29920 RepID=A0A8T1F7G0_9STRA|nr:hypothetical protein PC118_g20479 [Phytophthora cactorum]
MMVGLFAGLCTSEGHNKSRTGNKYQTSDGKMTAVAFAHQAVRNAKLDYHNPEFELIDQGYKRTNSQVDRKQSVTTPMLLKMREILGPMDPPGRLLWRSIILSFFFLDRCSKLWARWQIESILYFQVLAAQDCLRVRKETIKKAQVANLIKNAAKNMGLSQKDYSCHWLRTGGVCALLAAGKSDLVIRLMGRWSSWCFSVYATWNDTRRGK